MVHVIAYHIAAFVPFIVIGIAIWGKVEES
jgi:hypothetical protein